VSVDLGPSLYWMGASPFTSEKRQLETCVSSNYPAFTYLHLSGHAEMKHRHLPFAIEL
jgi:hypothetical protein